MKGFNYLVLIGVLLSLTACPLLNPPEAIAPLSAPKTTKSSYKSKRCRPLRAYSNDGQYWYDFTYDAEGKIVSARDFTGRLSTYVYTKEGYLDAVLFGIGNISFFYIYAPDGTHYLRSKVVHRNAFQLDNVFLYDAGTLSGCFYSNDPYTSWCDVDRFGTVLAYRSLTTAGVLAYVYDNVSQGRTRDNVTTRSSLNGQNLEGQWTYEFDRNPSPLSLVAIKDVPQPAELFSLVPEVNNRNNFTKETYTNYVKGNGRIDSYVATYSYTYNAYGLPEKVTKRYNDGRVVAWTNVYEGCN